MVVAKLGRVYITGRDASGRHPRPLSSTFAAAVAHGSATRRPRWRTRRALPSPPAKARPAGPRARGRLAGLGPPVALPEFPRPSPDARGPPPRAGGRDRRATSRAL